MTPPSILKKAAWAVMLLLAILMALMASRYLSLNPAVYFPEQKAVYMAQPAGLLLHIVGAMLAIIIGPFQFLPSIRRRWLNLHRWLGRTYLLSVLFGGLGGLYMAFLAYGGWAARLGFATLAVLWLFSAYQAYRHIRNKDIQRHREWMLRNYALTFTAVTLRLLQIVFQVAGLDPAVAYITLSWLSWMLNLAVAEFLIRRLPPFHSLSSAIGIANPISSTNP